MLQTYWRIKTKQEMEETLGPNWREVRACTDIFGEDEELLTKFYFAEPLDCFLGFPLTCGEVNSIRIHGYITKVFTYSSYIELLPNREDIQFTIFSNWIIEVPIKDALTTLLEILEIQELKEEALTPIMKAVGYKKKKYKDSRTSKFAKLVNCYSCAYFRKNNNTKECYCSHQKVFMSYVSLTAYDIQTYHPYCNYYVGKNLATRILIKALLML